MLPGSFGVVLNHASRASPVMAMRAGAEHSTQNDDVPEQLVTAGRTETTTIRRYPDPGR